MKPVGAKAQKKVPMPNGLNLDEWIIEQSEEEEEKVDDADELDNDIDQAVFEFKNSQAQCNCYIYFIYIHYVTYRPCNLCYIICVYIYKFSLKHLLK